jgi:hypothetical protein
VGITTGLNRGLDQETARVAKGASYCYLDFWQVCENRVIYSFSSFTSHDARKNDITIREQLKLVRINMQDVQARQEAEAAERQKLLAALNQWTVEMQKRTELFLQKAQDHHIRSDARLANLSESLSADFAILPNSLGNTSTIQTPGTGLNAVYASIREEAGLDPVKDSTQVQPGASEPSVMLPVLPIESNSIQPESNTEEIPSPPLPTSNETNGVKEGRSQTNYDYTVGNQGQVSVTSQIFAKLI